MDLNYLFVANGVVFTIGYSFFVNYRPVNWMMGLMRPWCVKTDTWQTHIKLTWYIVKYKYLRGTETRHCTAKLTHSTMTEKLLRASEHYLSLSENLLQQVFKIIVTQIYYSISGGSRKLMWDGGGGWVCLMVKNEIWWEKYSHSETLPQYERKITKTRI